MRFEPKTEKQIAEEGLLQPGVYDFEVVKGEDRQSKSGNDMIELVLSVTGDDGSARRVTDYLLEKLAYKLRHAAATCGVLGKYERGDLCGDDFMGRAGRVKLKIQASEGYPDKNAVVDYVVEEKKASAAPARRPAMADNDLDDSIPF